MTLFEGMTEEERAVCLKRLSATERKYLKGSIIFHAGDKTEKMGVVLSGSVTIERNDVFGNCTVLSFAGEGQSFGEAYALFRDEIMTVDVCANEETAILFLDIGGLLGLQTTEMWKEKFVCNLLKVASRKNLTLSERSFHTSHKSCRARLMSYLNSVSMQLHSKEFDIPFSRQQLADYLNLERTNMSKEITKMKKDGLIECRKSHFKLLDE